MEYGINEIQSLSFKEGVRSRIQMYLGSDDLEGTYQAFKEIINKNKIEISTKNTTKQNELDSMFEETKSETNELDAMFEEKPEEIENTTYTK